MAEFQNPINSAKNSTARCDQICYKMLKHVPQSSKDIILKLCNDIWFSGIFPKSWIHAIVIPIPKRGEPLIYPTSYVVSKNVMQNYGTHSYS